MFGTLQTAKDQNMTFQSVVIVGLMRMIVWIQCLVQAHDIPVASVLGTNLPNGDQEVMCSYGLVGHCGVR